MKTVGLLLLITFALAVQGKRALHQAPAPAVDFETLPDLTASQIVSLLCSRAITAVDYVQALDERYSTGDYACNNPWITYNISQVLADAAAIDNKYERGESILPLCGLPLAEAYPSHTAPLVQQYLNANGIIQGKTNLGELQSGGATNPTSSGMTTITSTYPPNPVAYEITTALNPHDPTRTPSGSSSGSAVATAARLTPWALCEGAFARTGADLSLLDSIIRSPTFNTTSFGSVSSNVSCAVSSSPINLQGLRLGLPSEFGWNNTGLSLEVQGVTNAALAKLQAAGVVLVPFNSSAINQAAAVAWPGSTTTGGNLDFASNYEAPEALARWLYLNGYHISVPDLYSQINRPALKSSSLASIVDTSVSNAQSEESYIYYLKYGRPNITAAWQNLLTTNNISAFLYPVSTVETPPLDRGSVALFRNTTGAYAVTTATGQTGANAQIGGSAGTFPIGVTASKVPVSLEVGSVPGTDSLILGVLRAMDGIFPNAVPAPPNPSLCAGCNSRLFTVTQTWNGTAGQPPQPRANDTWTNYALQFSGASCAPSLLAYGQSGPIASGVPSNTTFLPNNITLSSA